MNEPIIMGLIYIPPHHRSPHSIVHYLVVTVSHSQKVATQWTAPSLGHDWHYPYMLNYESAPKKFWFYLH